MADKPVGRPMKYPYTFTAKLAQFPYLHYFKHNWVARYYCYSFLLCTPLFYGIQELTFSPQNVATWEEKRRKEAAEHH